MEMLGMTILICVENLVGISIILDEIQGDVLFHSKIQNFGSKTPHAKLKSRFDCKNSLQNGFRTHTVQLHTTKHSRHSISTLRLYSH